MISVLLVDDEPPMLESGKRYLEAKGHYNVSATLSPLTALGMLKTGHYDIIISDYNMPDMDGIGFLKQVRAAYPTLPFILYTSKSRSDIAGEAFDNEADFYLQRTGNPILVMEELTQKIQLIVERRRMQEALRASEEKYRTLFSGMPSGVAIYESVDNGEDFVFRDFNTAGEAIEHVRKEDVICRRVTEVFPGVKEFGVFSVFQRVWRTGKPEFFPSAVYQNGRSPDTWRESWIYKLPTGEIVSIYNDVTDRKHAEEELRSHQKELTMQNEELRTIQQDLQVSRDQYMDLYDLAPVGYLTISTQGLVLKANLTAATLLNVERSKLIKAPVSRFVVTSDQNTYYQHLKQLADTNQQQMFELKIRRQGGSSPIWAQIIMEASQVGEDDEAACNLILLDITDRKRAEVALRESEERFRLTFELASIGKSLTAIDGKLKKVNRAFCEMLGYTAQELQEKGFAEVTHPDDVAKSKESVRTLLAGEHPMYRFEKRYIRKDGATVWADVSTMLLRDIAGKPLTFITHIMDITERKKAEDTLRQIHEQLIKSEELLKETGRMALVGGWEIDVATLQQVWTDEVYRIHEVEPGFMPTVEDGIRFYVPEARPVIAEAVRRAIELGEPFDVELGLITAKGNRRWVHAIGKAHRVAGKTVKVFGTFQDITEWKKSQDLLQASETRYRRLFEAAQDGILIVDANIGQIIDVNPFLINMLGFSREQFLETKLWEIGFFKDIVANKDNFEELQKKEYIRYEDLPLETTDGRHIDVEFISNVYTVDDKKVIQCNIRNITERKRAEDALQLTNAILSTQMEVAIEGVLAVDESGKIIIYNHRFTEIWGISPEVIASRADERVLQSVLDKLVNPEEFLTRVRYLYAHREEKSIEEVLLNDGRVLERYSAPMYGENNQYYGRVWHFRDITDQKKAEQEITRIAHEWETTFNATSDGICLIDANQKLQRCNTRMSEILGGMRQEDLAGKSCWVVVHKTTGPIPECPFVSAKKTLKRIRVEIPDGDLWFEVTVDPILDSSGTFAGAVHIMRDITDRKRAQEALRQLSADHKAIIDHAPAMIWYKDTKNTFVRVNPTCARVFGMAIEEIEGKSTYDLFPDFAEKYYQEDLEVINSGKPKLGIIEPRTSASGEHLWVQTDKIPLRDEQGNITGILVFAIDITERKHAEDALALAIRKLNLLSSITRHDLLNQLTALRAYIELSKEELDKQTLAKYIGTEEKIADTLEKQINFTREYQDLGVTAPVWQNVNASITKAVTGLPMRDIRVEVDPKNPAIFADPLFEKVFYNLIDNALRYGGADMKTIRVSSRESDRELTILCEDDGVGISAEDKKKLFTRGFGKNTGLGLFLSREILAITGITITENGVPGKGARFEITVPKGMYRFMGVR